MTKSKVSKAARNEQLPLAVVLVRPSRPPANKRPGSDRHADERAQELRERLESEEKDGVAGSGY